jgi:SecD/SecF fusion protein
MNQSPTIVFLWGLLLLFLLFFYLGTTVHRSKKIAGTSLILLMALFCAWAINSFGIKKGIDIGGGSSFTVQLQPGEGTDGKPQKITPDSIQQAIAILEKRLNPNGEKDLTMAPAGEDRILIQMPGIKPEDVENVRQTIQQVAHLEFRLVNSQSTSLIEGAKKGGLIPPGWMELPYKENADRPELPHTILVKPRADLDGSFVTNAYAYNDPLKGWAISLEFSGEGSKLFGKLTTDNVNHQLAIVVDNVVISAPNLNEPILGGRAEISGKFKENEARALATALQNPLKNPMKIIEESSVSAGLGEATIKQGVYTGIVGSALIAVFMLIYYRFAGLVALAGVAVNLLMIFGAMALFNITLTMPGIAGIALTVGMGVDANVLIYERLREEIRNGKPFISALVTAFEKAFAAIFDVHVTTLITSLILFFLASGLVKGFALTLTVGIFGTLFGALIVTRVVFNWFADAGKFTHAKFAEFIPHRTFDVLSYAKPFIIGSFALAAISLATFFIKGKDGIGIDFRGGSLVRFQVNQGQTVTEKEITALLPVSKFGQWYEQRSATPTSGELLTIRCESDKKEEIRTTLANAFPQKLHDGEIQTVGSVVGSELAVRSAWAYVAAMVAILIYLSVFYEFPFALGAIVALFHDCIIVVGLSVLFGQELSVIHIGAVLTVAGYSINDTIIVFDRIREIIRAKAGTGKIRDIMNEAISITLSRTLLTSLTALMPMLALFIFGGPAMKEFSLPITIGIIVGTYSSIYIAAPIVLWYARKTGRSLHRAVLDTAERQESRSKSMASA